MFAVNIKLLFLFLLAHCLELALAKNWEEIQEPRETNFISDSLPSISIFVLCPSEIINTEDTIICVGNSIELIASGFDQYQWTPHLGLSNPAIGNPIASPLTTTSYIVSAYGEGPNLIVNGNFEQGNFGFTSDYNLNPTNIGVNGDYAITNNVIIVHPLAAPCTDHTTGAGLLMAVNGGPVPNTTIWGQTVNVDPFTDYMFSAWVTNWSSIQSNLARLQFSINGQLIGLVFQTLPQQCQWTEFFVIWNSGPVTSADIRLINQNLAVIGNDFGLDDLSFNRICTGVDTITIVVQDIMTLAETIQICQGDSLWLEGSWQTSPGVYLDTLGGGLNCDTVRSTLLEVLPSFESEMEFTICEGDSVNVAGKIYKTPGSFVDSLSTNPGCDSILHIQLFVLPVQSLAQETSICEADSFYVGDNVYYTEGIYVDTLNALNGCDSVVTTTLIIIPKSRTSIEDNLCGGEVYDFNGLFLDQPGLYIDTLQSVAGCDSIIELDLVLLPVVVFAQDVLLCEGDTVFVGTRGYAEAGMYHDTIIAASGCDSIVMTTVTEALVNIVFIDTTICEGETYSIADSAYNLPGIYVDTLVAADGCDSIIHLELSVLDTAIRFVDISICPGDTVMIGNDPVSMAGIYTVTLQTASGCDSTLIYNLTYHMKEFCLNEQCRIYAPNVFSPNGDGINDRFVLFPFNVELSELTIYDRWGGILYYAREVNPQWDGTSVSGKPAPPGVYVWLARGMCNTGELIHEFGDVTLIR